jgi:hypothetical protein
VAGLISDALPGVIDSKTHGIIDYAHAGANIVAGILFRNRNRRASNACFAPGASILVNALCTDYELGVFRAYDFKVHGILDYGVAAASAAMPMLLGLEGTPERSYFYGQGAMETVIAGITDYNDNSGARRTSGMLDELERAA